MNTRALMFLLLSAVISTARGQEPFRYAWLTATNLPPPGVLVEAAIDALPKSVKQKQEWVERMRKAAWMPTLELRYGLGEAIVRNYRVVDRVETTSGSESQREREFQQSDGAQSTVRTDLREDRDGLGTLEGSSASTGSETGTSTGTQRSDRSSRSRFQSTTYSGPDSYATGERTEWVDDFGVALSWDLSRLLFREEEIAVSRAELDRAAFKQGVRDQVVQTYYDLMESVLLLESETYRSSVPTRVKRERLAFLLDTLTDGALSASARPTTP